LIFEWEEEETEVVFAPLAAWKGRWSVGQVDFAFFRWRLIRVRGGLNPPATMRQTMGRR